MFTTIDKNLLIAALESALLYAQNSAGVTTLEDLTAQIAELRTAFSADPDTVTDDMLEAMIATLQALEIPDPAQLARLLTASNVTNTSTYLAVCSWATLLNKPATFPPSDHQHTWSQVTFKPATFPPATHTHTDLIVDWDSLQEKPATFPADPHAHDYASITSKPLMFPPTAHEHDYSSLLNKPATFPPDAHDHPSPSAIASPFQFGDLIFRRGEIEGVLDYSMDGGQSWDWRFPPVQHMHADYGDIDYPVRDEIMKEVTARQKAGNIYLIPSSLVSVYASYQHFTAVCNGSTILRATPAGDLLVSGGCQFGNGDGSTTVNLPDMTALAPAGFAYVMFIGSCW